VKRIRPALLIATTALLAAACTQTPTAGAAPGSARHDGGNTLGGGGSVPTDSTRRGGNTMGSGG
jgi:hypothetical protein